jgi:hypothetical protein
MSDFEKRADSLLEAVERKHRIESELLRKVGLVSFNRFSLGDPVRVTLIGASDNGDMTRQIAGRLFDPSEGLLQISGTDMPELDDQRLIGLTTVMHNSSMDEIFVPGMVAGNSAFGYYKPRYISCTENIEKSVGLRDPMKVEGLRYGRVAVNATALFDFTSKTWAAPSNKFNN